MSLAKKLVVDISPVLRKFYDAANAIFSYSKYVSDIAKLHLFESFTLPLMTYGLDAVSLTQPQLAKLNACWNNIYRRIFGYRRWESVKQVQFYCERLDFLRIIDKYRFKFYNKLYRYSNYVVRQCLLYAEQNLEFRRLYFSYDVCVGDILFLVSVFI